MSIDYSIQLSLDRAKLVSRKRKNFLGTKDLVLDYNLAAGGTKEEAAAWLESNRLTLTNPKFGFKTYIGPWKCISIEFDEDTKMLRQRFGIDSSLPNDVAERTQNGQTLANYYFRVVDPGAYTVPDTPVDAGDTWTKRVNDNGDGTYDVIITKETRENATGTEYNKGYAGSTTAVIANSPTSGVNGDYLYRGVYRLMDEDSSPSSLVKNKSFHRADEMEKENGEYVWIDANSTYGVWFDGSKWVITAYAGIGETLTAYYKKTSSPLSIIGAYEVGATWTNPPTMEMAIDVEWWEKADGSFAIQTGLIDYTSATLPIYYVQAGDQSTATYTNVFGLSPQGWSKFENGETISYGINPSPTSEYTVTYFSSSELKFKSETADGTEDDPVAGERKTIVNTPLGDGKFKSVVQTITANRQRHPIAGKFLWPALYNISGYVDYYNSSISGTNMRQEDLDRDVRYIGDANALALYSHSVSARVNEFGLIDYNISSYLKG